MNEETSALFVVDGPAMAAQGLLLASSLRAHGGDIAITACLPATSDPLPDGLRAAFSRLDVPLATFDMPEGTWAKPYPHGNKILACCAVAGRQTTVFLDTDTLVAAPLALDRLAPPGGIAAVPEGKATWGDKNDRWARAYAHFDLPLPAPSVRLTRGRRRMSVPYFNAGFVAFDADADFPRLWRETAREIDFDLAIGKKRPWLDQIALPIAAARHDIPVRVLEDDWNYSISDREPRPVAPAIVHYHRYGHNHGWPFFRAAFDRLVSDLGGLPEDAEILRAGLDGDG